MREAQRKALESGLRNLEEFLLELLEDLEGRRPLRMGALSQERDPLPREAEWVSAVQALLLRVQEMAQALGARPRIRSRMRHRLAQMALLWAELEDLGPEGLARYGPMDAESALWAQRVGALAEELMDLMALLGEREVEGHVP